MTSVVDVGPVEAEDVGGSLVKGVEEVEREGPNIASICSYKCTLEREKKPENHDEEAAYR